MSDYVLLDEVCEIPSNYSNNEIKTVQNWFYFLVLFFSYAGQKSEFQWIVPAKVDSRKWPPFEQGKGIILIFYIDW